MSESAQDRYSSSVGIQEGELAEDLKCIPVPKIILICESLQVHYTEI